MADEVTIFPLDFHLVGTPVSLQGKAASKERWKTVVADAARERIGQITDWTYLDSVPVALTIYYFPIAPMGGDIDNIVKPIMDALIGIVYLDDNVVERVTVQKFEPAVPWEFISPTEQLAVALDAASSLDTPTPVVYIYVANDLSWRRL